MSISTKIAQEMLEFEIEANGYNLNKYLPRGFIPQMMEQTGRTRNVISYCLGNIRTKLGVIKLIPRPKSEPKLKGNFTRTGLCVIVEGYLDAHNYNLTKRFPNGSLDQIAKDLSIDKNQLKDSLKVIKKKKGIMLRKTNTVIKPPVNNLVEVFTQFKIERKSPNQNRISSDIMCRALVHDIPKGGVSMMIGTATPFAISPNPKNNCLLTDELDIASTLRFTCDKDPIIIVGNLISPEKAETKGKFWKNINSTCNSVVIVGRVDRDSFTRHVTNLAEPNLLAKVVLITSGVWPCSKPTRRKYGYDFNYQAPSLYLSTVYPNLHILAMVMHGNLFKVHYVHNGKETVL